MAIQRKIYHLLKSEGTEETFRYLLSLRAPFDLLRPVLMTEKVDGSTMQSCGGMPWKRFDRFKAGDPRKHSASESERYELRPCRADDPSVKWYLAGFEAHKAAFEEFGRRYFDRWIYFESLGGKIGARYKDLDPTIRVFDTSYNGVFLPFAETVKTAYQVGLPVVQHREEIFGTLENLLEVLAHDVSGDSKLPPHQLEGWVLRQGEVVAKIRVKDLNQIKV